MPLRLPGNLGNLDFSDWLYGLISGFVSGGATTVVTMFTAALSDPEHFRPGSHAFFKLLYNVFIASGVINAMNFLRTKPLPGLKMNGGLVVAAPVAQPLPLPEQPAKRHNE